MRNRTPRSFTVETKSSRRQRTFIPHRAEALSATRPDVSWPVSAEPRAPAAEPRRILPSLIAPEASPDEPELAPAAEEHSPKPRRGRPPKAKPAAAEMAEEPIAALADELSAIAPTPMSGASEASQLWAPRATKLPTILPLGERWKRRLGRWAR